MLAVAALVVTPMLALQGDGNRRVAAAQGWALAERMAVLRTAAQAWARSHPGYDGPLDVGLLDTPDWWRGDPELHALVQGRIVAVYASWPASHAVLSQMTRLSNGSIWVGTAEGGTLHSPTTGDTGIAVPSAVPERAPVWLALRD
jgi:hypothetical protein